MEFSNLYFLYILLPLTMLVYFLMPTMDLRNKALLGISMLFYAMGQPIYLIFMIGISYLNYMLSKRIVPGDKGSIVLPVAIDLLALAVFKYLDFFLSMIGIVVEHGVLMSFYRWIIDVLNSIGFSIQYPTTVLPIGISFYIFSMISYLGDVYTGKVEIEEKFESVLLCWLMYPQLLMGPIVRYEQVQMELHTRKMNPRMIFDGMHRFTVGLAEKVLIADYCGQIISRLATLDCDSMLVGSWLSALMFTFQLYFDFCGYSNMAIGLGMIFGFKYCENFDLPYTSKSITEFWRRWHMSLGTFFRDYVYIPLGGSRVGTLKNIRNLFVVWALTGIWHGANWTFIFWGLYYGVLLTAEKYLLKNVLDRIPMAVRRVTTLLLVVVGWVFFFSGDLGSAFGWLGAMFGNTEAGFADSFALYHLTSGWLPLVIAAFAACPLGGRIGERISRMGIPGAVVSEVWWAVLLMLCIAGMMSSTYSSFLYFQF